MEKLKSKWVIVPIVIIGVFFYVVLLNIVIKKFMFTKTEAPRKAVQTFEKSVDVVPTPTPEKPLTGPGDYACSPEGMCNLYGDNQRTQYCKDTFADPFCLLQCGNKAKQCTK